MREGIRNTAAAAVVGVVVVGVYSLVSRPAEDPVPRAADSLILTDYSKGRAGDCVRFSGPGEDDLGVSVIDCAGERASLRIGAVLSTSAGECPSGRYKLLRDTRHDASLCLLPNAREGDCFKLDVRNVQRSVVAKVDCALADVRVLPFQENCAPALRYAEPKVVLCLGKP
ncbi:hypothetical protein [Lentzea sp. NBRC 105346]|uniref:LppU/SCO3897 family protein n=1 Tax=Lentzea sp. NBRC 105346 TaxID=3032205 RepID=UPI002553BB12|nr:hypothetical protein [Lentzea sp. NBRC 105346]